MGKHPFSITSFESLLQQEVEKTEAAEERAAKAEEECIALQKLLDDTQTAQAEAAVKAAAEKEEARIGGAALVGIPGLSGGEMGRDSAEWGVESLEYKFATLFLKSAPAEYELSHTQIRCAGQLVQQVADQNFPQSSIYTVHEDFQSAWWSTQYKTTIKSVVDIIAQLGETNNADTEMGIARIWKVFLFHVLVDQYGDTPYFDSDGLRNAASDLAYDDDKEIYIAMLRELRMGVAQIGQSSILGSSDLVFNGNTGKWKRFGNSLMLRLAMRIRNVDDYESGSWAREAISGGTMRSNDDTAYISYFSSLGLTHLNRNSWGTYASNDNNNGARIGATLYDWLREFSDPRLNILADPNGPPAGNRYGLKSDELWEKHKETPYSYAAVNPAITKITSPWVFLSYAQTALLEAELLLRNGDVAGAQVKYNDGVKAHMQIWGDIYDKSLAVDDGDVQKYLDETRSRWGTRHGLQMIGEQYWVASFFDFFEAFSNFRRSGYPELEPFGGEDPHVSNTTNGQIPRRLMYPPSEKEVNLVNYTAVLEVQGENNQLTRVWWDPKTN